MTSAISGVVIPPSSLGAGSIVHGGSTKMTAVGGMVLGYEPDAAVTGPTDAIDYGDGVWEWPKYGLGDFMQRSSYSIQPPSGGTTLEKLGIGALTEFGTKAAVHNASGNFISYTTAGAAGDEGGFYVGSGNIRRELSPWFNATIYTLSSYANQRSWYGLFSSTPMGSADPAVSGIGWRGPSDASADWCGWVNDGAGGGTKTTDVVLSTSTRYDLSFAVVGSAVLFFINGKFYERLTTNLPAAATALTPFAQVRSLSASAKVVNIGRVAGHHL